MKRALLCCAMLAVTAAIMAGCKGSGSTAAPVVTPLPTSSFRAGLTVMSFGDDFTVGIGTSFCGVNLSSTPCQTNSTLSGVLASANPRGWAQILSSYLTLPRYQPAGFIAAGVTGALTGGAPLPEASPGDIQKNTGQFGSIIQFTGIVRASNIKMLITFQGGINDVLDAFYSSQCVASGGTVKGGGGASLAAPCTASNTTLADASGNVRNGTYYTAVRSMLANLQSTAGGPPEATMVIGVPDLGQFPAYATATVAQRAALTSNSKLANAALSAAIGDSGLQNVTFVDWLAYLAANPQYYGTTYFSSDLFHLSDSGYAVLEALVQQQFLTAFPSV